MEHSKRCVRYSYIIVISYTQLYTYEPKRIISFSYYDFDISKIVSPKTALHNVKQHHELPFLCNIFSSAAYAAAIIWNDIIPIGSNVLMVLFNSIHLIFSVYVFAFILALFGWCFQEDGFTFNPHQGVENCEFIDRFTSCTLEADLFVGLLLDERSYEPQQCGFTAGTTIYHSIHPKKAQSLFYRRLTAFSVFWFIHRKWTIR